MSKGIPKAGDRSAHDMNYPHLHASDIEDDEFVHHVPEPGTDGQIVESQGGVWVVADPPEGGGAVDSVNGQTGTVLLNPDHLDDSTTSHKFTSAAEQSKLAGIEAGAEVNNMSDANAAELTGGGDTTLHTHAGGGGAVDSVNGQTGVVVLDAGDIDGLSHSSMLYFDSRKTATSPYLSLVKYPTDNASSISSSATITADDTLIGSFMTIEDCIRHMPEHDAILRLVMYKYPETAGIKNGVAYANVYHRDAAGTETLLGTSTLTDEIADFSEVMRVCKVHLPDTIFRLGEALVIKVYANPVGSGTDPTIYLRQNRQGSYLSSFNFSGNLYATDDGWIRVREDWSRKQEFFTNDPSIGTNVVLNILDGYTHGFEAGDHVIVSSSAGEENTTVVSTDPGVSITVAELTLNHTTTNPIITHRQSIRLNGDFTAYYDSGWYARYTLDAATYPFVWKYGRIGSVIYDSVNDDTYLKLDFIGDTYALTTDSPVARYSFISKIENPDGLPEDVKKIPPTTAVNDFLIGDGVSKWFKKTLAEVVTILRTALDSIYASSDGWVPASGTWTYSSIDDPTGVIDSDADEDGIQVGDRIVFENDGNTIYGIVTVKTGSPSTITFLHEIDPSDNLALTLMANETITNPRFSHAKFPLGFSSDKTHWSVSLIDTADRAGTTTGISNPGSLSINIPIGSWDVKVSGLTESVINLGGNQLRSNQFSLSTSASAHNTDTELYGLVFLTAAAAANSTMRSEIIKFKLPLVLASKTTYYITLAAGGTTTPTSVTLKGSLVATVVKCVSSYF